LMPLSRKCSSSSSPERRRVPSVKIGGINPPLLRGLHSAAVKGLTALPKK
jgi:hypothetical protein